MVNNVYSIRLNIRLPLYKRKMCLIETRIIECPQ